MKTTKEITQEIQKMLTEKYPSFSAKQEGKKINIFDKRGDFAGVVENGKIIAKYQGQKVLLGSLIRNDIRSILEA